MESSYDSIVLLDAKGAVTHVNAAFQRTFQYEPSQVIGRDAEFLLCKPKLPTFKAYIERYKSEESEDEGGERGWTLRGLRRDGTEFPLRMCLSVASKSTGACAATAVLRDLSPAMEDREQLHGILESCVDPIVVIDDKGIIVRINHATLKTFGYSSRDELVGSDVSMLMPEPHRSAHAGYLRRYTRTGKSSIMGVGRRLQGVTKDGKVFPLFLTLSAAKIRGKDFYTGIIRDITAEEEERQNISAILQSCVDPIIVIDEFGFIIRVNRATSTLCGYSPEEMVGNNIKMLMTEDVASKHDSYLQRYQHGKGGNSDVVGRGRPVEGVRKDGSCFPIHLSVSEMRRGGKRFFVGIMRDLTDLERAVVAESELHMSESILLNILPPSITDRLKNKKRKGSQSHIADFFENVDILFADIVGFTSFASKHPPEVIVRVLNDIFCRFDRLVEKHKLEKIKTIGDAYMVVSGLNSSKEHSLRMLRCGLEMIEEIERYEGVTYRSSKGKKMQTQRLTIRVGVNTGDVIAGVVGTKKFLYDLWGDAVNVASRMESHGIASYLQCTESTAINALQYSEEFVVLERGQCNVKGKGPMPVYIVVRVGDLEDAMLDLSNAISDGPSLVTAEHLVKTEGDAGPKRTISSPSIKRSKSSHLMLPNHRRLRHRSAPHLPPPSSPSPQRVDSPSGSVDILQHHHHHQLEKQEEEDNGDGAHHCHLTAQVMEDNAHTSSSTAIIPGKPDASATSSTRVKKVSSWANASISSALLGGAVGFAIAYLACKGININR